MKIHVRGRPRPFSYTKVTCLDSIMAEMLACVPDTTNPVNAVTIAEMREMQSSLFIHSFCCGASLKVGMANNEFFVFTQMQDGSDGMAAFEELKMLDALRLAKKHFLAMKVACYRPGLDTLHLRVTQF